MVEQVGGQESICGLVCTCSDDWREEDHQLVYIVDNQLVETCIVKQKYLLPAVLIACQLPQHSLYLKTSQSHNLILNEYIHVKFEIFIALTVYYT